MGPIKKMTNEEFYGEEYKPLQRIQRDFYNKLMDLKEDNPEHIMYVTTRLKTADSALEKLKRKDIEYEDMYDRLNDILGFRIICPFVSDIYLMADEVLKIPRTELIQIKDYIKNPKESGYRCYHLIINYSGRRTEVQIRTIALDFWATLEHKMKYKKDIKDREFVTEEFKKAAKEIAELDSNMETLRELIQ